jgi:hypothetical protein
MFTYMNMNTNMNMNMYMIMIINIIMGRIMTFDKGPWTWTKTWNPSFFIPISNREAMSSCGFSLYGRLLNTLLKSNICFGKDVPSYDASYRTAL